MPPLPLLLLSSLQLLSSTYTPPDKYFIDCGSSCNTTVSDGWIFVGDLNPPFAFSPGESKHVRDSNLSNNTPSLYHTARIFRDPSSYELEVDHNGTYMVRLHFFPFSSPINLSDAVFEVWADSSSFNLSASAFQLLSNFSVSDSSLPVIEEFLLSINEGKFSLYFVPSQKPSSSFAFVDAIKVFPVPDHFISDSAAGSNCNYSDLRSHVFHTIHRINVGGPKIRPDDDILWRSQDQPARKFSLLQCLLGLEIFEIWKKSGALPIQGQPMKRNQSTAVGSYFGFVIVMGIIALVPDLKRRKAMLAKGKMNSQESQAERNKILPVAWDFDCGLKISFAKIRKATKNFDSTSLIRESSFGKIHVGVLEGFNVEVKQFVPRDKQGFSGFQTEIMVCSQISHRHLVRFFGYCDERSEDIDF
ncbi:hypothetical protein UlMin_039142 [Ulmus minor]